MKTLAFLLVALCFISCSTVKIRTKDLQALKSKSVSSFNDIAIKPDSLAHSMRLTNLFGLEKSYDDLVKISVEPSGELKIISKNVLGGNNFIVFKGKSKKHYYEIYLEKKRIPFPPIYSISKINRIRLSISDEGLLVVNMYRNHSGMILLMAAGSSSKNQYRFQISNQ